MRPAKDVNKSREHKKRRSLAVSLKGTQYGSSQSRLNDVPYTKLESTFEQRESLGRDRDTHKLYLNTFAEGFLKSLTLSEAMFVGLLVQVEREWDLNEGQVPITEKKGGEPEHTISSLSLGRRPTLLSIPANAL